MAGMDELVLTCPDCMTGFEPGDNYCRRCGMYLAAQQPLTMAERVQEVRAVQTWRPGLPSPAVRAAAAVAVGTALQVGLALAVRALAASAKEAARPAPARPKRQRAVSVQPQRQVEPPANIAEVTETVVFQRRWRFKE